MTDEAPVSVIIRTYNRAAFLREALDSACGQDVRAREILVVDDGSQDDTSELLARFLLHHSNIRYIRLPVNRGMYRAAQIGFELSTMPHVAFLDSDDLWLPGHLSVCLAAMQSDPSLAMVYAKYGLVDAGGGLLIEEVREPMPAPTAVEAFLLKRVVVQPTRTVYSRAAIVAVGGVPHHDVVGDWMLNVRIAFRFPGGIRALDARTALFRIHDSQSYSRPAAVRDAFVAAADDLYRELPSLPASRGSVLAISLVHCAVFFWQAGDWREGWRCLYRATRQDPSVCATRGFVAAASRLAIPPRLGGAVRRWRRAQQRHSSSRNAATAAR